jgi:hypothetical protein
MTELHGPEIAGKQDKGYRLRYDSNRQATGRPSESPQHRQLRPQEIYNI